MVKLAVCGQWEEVQKDVWNCTECRKSEFGEVRCEPPNKTPTVSPSKISVLFISEAPPASGQYFYDESQEDRLRENLFCILSRLGFHLDNVENFVSSGFYLVPTVKCPSQKNGSNRSPRKRVVRLCVNKHLKREIPLIKPAGICLLGRIALYGFSRICHSVKFKKLSSYRRKIEQVEIDGNPTSVLISYWPTKRTNGFEILTQDLPKLLFKLKLRPEEKL